MSILMRFSGIGCTCLMLLFLSGCSGGQKAKNNLSSVGPVEGPVAPVGPLAYPSYGQCLNTEIPSLPAKWSTNVLLTPFQSQPLTVSRVSADSSGPVSKMVVTVDEIDGENPKSWYVVGAEVFELTNVDDALHCKPVDSLPTKWQAPSTDFLSGKGCTCQGSNIVTGVDSEAWRCPNGESLQPGASEYDWYWFAKSDKSLHRIINSRNNNYHQLPVLGDASLVNFTSVSQQVDPLLVEAEEACSLQSNPRISIESPELEGVSIDTNPPKPPTWPDTAFANGALFAIDGSHTSMAIYYDWPARQEVSKIKASDNSIEDTRLTSGITYEVSYHGGARQCDGTLVNVGIWRPDWAAHDSCEYKATIAANSPLNPGDVPLQAMSCFFGKRDSVQSNIQAWYSYEEHPVMFYETNAADLDLIDYERWIPDAVIPEGVLYPIDSCEGHAQQFDQCNACHGKES